MVNLHCEGLAKEMRRIHRSAEQLEQMQKALDECLQWEARQPGAPMREESIETSSAYDGPSIWIRGFNFATAIARWTSAGMPRRSQSEIDERLAICQACPELVGNHCQRCGCACVETNQLMNKLALATEVCPIGKWK